MPDQADRLRELISLAEPPADAVAPLPPAIAVTGSKGGVGTTTVALNLAVALTRSGHRTTLVDAAPNADVAQMAGIDDSGCRTLDELLAGGCELAEALLPGPSGVCLIAGRGASAELPDRTVRAARRLLHRLAELSSGTDVLVVDTGSGMTPWARTIWQQSNLVFLVTTSNDTAVLDAYATIKHFGDTAADVRVLVNQCDDSVPAADAATRIAEACQRFLGRTIGRAPRLPHEQAKGHSNDVFRAWDMPRCSFVRAVHQLGRFAGDLLSQQRSALEQATLSDN